MEGDFGSASGHFGTPKAGDPCGGMGGKGGMGDDSGASAAGD